MWSWWDTKFIWPWGCGVFMAIRTVALWCESNSWDKIAASHQPFFSLWGEMTTNDIVKIRKPQTRLKRTQFALRLHRITRTTVRRGKRSLFLHLQLILAFISLKLIFSYKFYKSYTELGLPVAWQVQMLLINPRLLKASLSLSGHPISVGMMSFVRVMSFQFCFLGKVVE